MRHSGVMPNSLPFPVRVAAGLVSTGLETVRGLPQNLPAFGVEILGRATRTGMQVRQQFLELALRGDELLHSEATEDHPAWARFDDEEPSHLETDTDPGPSSQHAGLDSDGRISAETEVLPGFDAMTLAQIRGHLRHLSVHQVQQLLDHERAVGNRPAMLTMLSNRIVSLQHQ